MSSSTRCSFIKLYLKERKPMKIVAFLLFTALIGNFYLKSPRTHSKNSFAIAADNGTCDRLGMEIMKNGGNSVDGAVVTTLCIGVFSQQSSGIGGDGFITVFNAATGEKEFINFRAVLPKNLNLEDLWESCTDPEAMKKKKFGTCPFPNKNVIALPTFLKGIEYVHKKYGNKPFSDCVQKIINFIEKENGGNFVFGKRNMASRANIPYASLKNHAKAYSLTPEEYLKRDKFKIPGYLSFLKDLARHGSDVIYSNDSQVLKEILDASLLTKEEILNYEPITEDPLNYKFMNKIDVFSSKAPSGGYFLKLILEVFEFVHSYYHQTDINHYDKLAIVLKECYIHMQDIYEHNYLEKLDDTINEVIEQLNGIIKHRPHWHEKIDRKKEVDYKPFSRGTSHISAVDSKGLAISVTTSNNRNFGSSVFTEHSKIILNDDNCDAIDYLSVKDQFDKGVRSAMTPTIIQGQNLLCSIGSKGSQKIPQGISQVLINHFVLNMSWSESVASDRIYYYSGEITYEQDASPFTDSFNKQFTPWMVKDVQNYVFLSCFEDGKASSYPDPRHRD